MELIKENKEKNRAVFKLNHNTIRKYWYDYSIIWVSNHIKILEKIVPDYIIGYGSDHYGAFADFKKLEGIPASNFPHSDKFIFDIYNYCLKNIKETHPYVHGDWVLSNIIINKNKFSMCDWDNISIRSKEETMYKLKKDLYSAFGNKIFKVIK